MLVLNRWQSSPAFLLIVSLPVGAIAPLTLPSQTSAAPSSLAQLFPSSTPNRSVTIPSGSRIPARYTPAERIIVAPNETVPLTITVSRNVRASSGEMLIPAGSEVKGNIQPVGEGSQFIAESLILPDGDQIPMKATSEVITKRQEVQPGVSGDALIKGSAIGAGAATLLSAIFGSGRITIGRILLGAGAGALGGLVFGKKTAEVIVIDSNADLTLTLNSRLTVPTIPNTRF